MHGSDVSEGKIELIADRDGLFKVNRQGLYAVNRLGKMMIACRHGDLPVKKATGWREPESFPGDRTGKNG